MPFYCILLSSSLSVPLHFRSISALHLAKCPQPKNPLYADSGLGCAHDKILCTGLVTIVAFLLALAPQSINTIGFSRSFSSSITLSVKISTNIFMTVCHTRSDSKCGIQKQNPLLCPGCKLAVGRRFNAKFILYLLKHILKRWRQLNSLF